MTVKLVADPYPPYQFEERGTIAGVDHDIITQSFMVHEIAAETSLHGWDECITLIGNKSADGVYQITRTPERAESFIFSERLRTARTLFFKSIESAVDLDGTLDLASQLGTYKIGVQSGYSYDSAIDDLNGKYKVERESSEDLLKGLLEGDFSLALVDDGVAAYLMQKLGIGGIRSLRGYEILRELYVAFNKDSGELTKLFNTGLRAIKKSGLYGELFRRYGLEAV